jgi:hypothetical protein
VNAVRQVTTACRGIANAALAPGNAAVTSREVAAVVPNVADIGVSRDAAAERRRDIDSLINRIRTAQKTDPDISVVLKRFAADASKPSWDDVSAWSANSKAIWSMWDHFELTGDVLYRRFFVASADRLWQQVIIPHDLRDVFIMIVHFRLRCVAFR